MKDAFQEDNDQVEIVPSFKSDYSGFTFNIKIVESQTCDIFLEFNAVFLFDSVYIALININYRLWLKNMKILNCFGNSLNIKLDKILYRTVRKKLEKESQKLLNIENSWHVIGIHLLKIEVNWRFLKPNMIFFMKILHKAP